MWTLESWKAIVVNKLRAGFASFRNATGRSFQTVIAIITWRFDESKFSYTQYSAYQEIKGQLVFQLIVCLLTFF